MEMMILSILAPQLHCEWKLPSYQVALITAVGSSQEGVLSLQSSFLFKYFFFKRSSQDPFLFPQVVFVGMCFGSPVWGNLSDKYGRRTVSSYLGSFFHSAVILLHDCLTSHAVSFQGLMISMSLTLYFGLLSSFAPVYGWFLFLRGLVGFGLGGAPQA